MAIGTTKVVQVTNIAPQATKDQMETLFGYLGKIEDIRLYPTIRDVSCPVQSRICYIKFADSTTVGIAQHMTNTVFIDRALIVIPVQSGDIPDEYFALEMTRNGTIVPGLCAAEPNLPPNVVNTLTTTGSGQVIVTNDPKLEANGLPVYPALPSNYDSRKIEEIRRTLLLVDVDPEITMDNIIEFFRPCEVKYLRACTRSSDDKRYILVEFGDQPTIIEALKYDGKEFNEKPIKVMHATQAIVKPQAKSNEAAQREIEEAMSRVKEAQNLISATIDPVIGMLSKDKRSSRRSRSRSRGRRRRSRSRSRSRKRSRSRHRSRRSRSKSRRSKSRDRKKRSKSRSKRRSRSRSRKSRSKSKPRTARRSKERKSREKSKEKSSNRRSSKERDRSRGKSKEKIRDSSKDKRSEKDSGIDEKRKKRLSRSPSKTKGRSRSRDRKRSRSRERKRSRSRGRKRTPSPKSSRKRSRSKSRDRDHRKDKKDRKSRKDRTPTPKKNEDKSSDDKKSRNSREHNSESDHREKGSSEKSDNMDISNSP